MGKDPHSRPGPRGWIWQAPLPNSLGVAMGFGDHRDFRFVRRMPGNGLRQTEGSFPASLGAGLVGVGAAV